MQTLGNQLGGMALLREALLNAPVEGAMPVWMRTGSTPGAVDLMRVWGAAKTKGDRAAIRGDADEAGQFRRNGYGGL